MKKSITYILILLMILMSTTIASYANSDIKKESQKETSGIEIISPSEDIIYSDYLLISVKIKDERAFRFSLYANNAIDGIDDINVEPIISSGAISVTDGMDQDDLLNNKIFYGPVEVKTTGAFSFYTIQLESLIPGKYQILIEETSDNKGNFTILKSFEIKDISERPKELADPKIFTDKPANKIQVLENIIKSIFGN